jgi:hypothetical protein
VKVIQYDETLEEYNGALLNTLRGFTPKYEFIASWVPDADLLRSVISLVEAAFSEQEFQFTLSFNKETLFSVNRKNFDARIEDIASFIVEEIDSGFNYHFTEMKSKNSQLSFQKNQVFNPSHNEEKKKSTEQSEKHSDEIYLSQINQYCEKALHSHPLFELDSLNLITLQYENITLQAQIDDNNIVKKLAYQGEMPVMQQGILTAACQLLINLPIEDIRDNGLTLVEYHLRKNSKQRKMAGIQIHFNFSEIFTPLKNLLNDLAEKSASKKVNFFDIRNQLIWDEDQKESIKQQLIKNISQYLVAHSIDVAIEVENVDDKAKVTLMLGESISANEKGQLLMDLEIMARKKVHPAIQLYSTLYIDRNTKRKGHQWAINL